LSGVIDDSIFSDERINPISDKDLSYYQEGGYKFGGFTKH